MKEISMFERELRDMLLEALQELPQVDMQPPLLERRIGCGKYRLDAEIHLNAAGHALTLLVEMKKSAYPRDIREMLWQIKKFGEVAQRDQQEGETVLLVAAEALSPGAKELLREEGVGYFDTGGSLYIPARGAFFYIDRPVPKTFERSVRSLYTGKRSHVLHALLDGSVASGGNVKETGRTAPRCRPQRLRKHSPHLSASSGSYPEDEAPPRSVVLPSRARCSMPGASRRPIIDPAQSVATTFQLLPPKR